MQSPSAPVKFVLSLTCIVSLACASFSSQAEPVQLTPIDDPRNTIESVWRAEKNYIAQNLKYPVFAALLADVERAVGRPLKNRGEAHITVITPPEWAILGRKIRGDEIGARFEENLYQSSMYEPVCVGRASLMGMSTYFVVVKAPDLLKFRREIARLFELRGGQPGLFNPEKYSPHITLGFTERDLHEQDGAIKNESSCWLYWN